MKKHFLIGSFALFSIITACGGNDDDNTVAETIPQVVSTTPVAGATDVSVGDITVKIVYNTPVEVLATRISVTGATLKGVSRQEGNKQLSLTVSCDKEKQLIVIDIPAGAVKSAAGKEAPTYSLSFTTKETESPTPINPGGDDGYESATDAVRNMGPGWNLGNTLDSYNVSIAAGSPVSTYETAWGQPVTEEFLMKKLKAKGFGAVRVPVTWFQHMDDAGNVDEAWMNRVEEVVRYVLNQDMYCILNVHHDTGAHESAWVVADNARYTATKDRYEKLWTQIATRFRDYGKKLLFEGYNEMLDANLTWTAPKDRSSLQAVNSYAQSFVNAVRATGGNNAQRNLIVTTYSASSGADWGNAKYVLPDFAVPTDPCGNQNHIAVEFHSYDPFDWVNTYNMTWTKECTDVLKAIFERIDAAFIQKGYPVIVGEYGSNGAGEKTINSSSTEAQKAEAGRQGADMMRLCKKYGAAGFYWMGLIEGNDRKQASFKWTMEQVADSIVNVYK